MIVTPAGEFNFPSPFFNPEWQADPAFEPFRLTPTSDRRYEGSLLDARLAQLGFRPGPPAPVGRS